MVSPFEFDEVPPGVESHSVRLPRRQAGGSPQGMAVTLLADYSLRTRAWLPSAAIVALLGESGVTSAGARAALSRLARRGALESCRSGRHSHYRLTEAAASVLAAGGRVIASLSAAAAAWDGRWTLIAFSLPRDADTQRRALRGRLRWLGYASLYDALWISPRRLQPEVTTALAATGLGTVTVFRATRVELDGIAGRDPIEAWDLASVARRYEGFVRHWTPLVPRIQAGSVPGGAALRARTEVMESYRHFVVLDPYLPNRLMPEGWLREPARAVFEAVYDGLAEPALGHVRAAVSGCGGLGVASSSALGAASSSSPDRWPDLATHTLGELLAGLRPASTEVLTSRLPAM